jgi:hypothetical protein
MCAALLWGLALCLALGTAERAQALSLASPASIVDPMVRTFGFSEDHRAYDPATPNGNKFDLGLEVTLLKFPSSIASLLGFNFPFLAAAKLHVRRGITERVDIGVSGLYLPPFAFLQNISIFNLGGDIKGIVWLQPEGPTVAIRVSYSYFSLSYPMFGVAPFTSILDTYTHTITPQILMSKKMGIVDPYVGVGYQIVLGGVASTTSLGTTVLAYLPFSSSAGGVLSFIGIKMDFKIMTLVLEGEYGQNDTPALGMKLGFNF